MTIILEIALTVTLLLLLILLSYRKWKYWKNEEEINGVDNSELSIAEKKKNRWVYILKFNAIAAFIPISFFFASATHEKLVSLISIIGLSVFIKIIDYIFKWFLKSKSIIPHLIFLSILGFTVAYSFILIVNYDLLSNLKK